MGLWLVENGRKFPQQPLAQRLGITERTLRNWERGAQGEKKLIGRPATSPSERFQACLKVARVLREQGHGAGWRPVLAKVKPMVSTRLVQESLRELKKRHRLKLSKRFKAHRVQVEVLSPNVIWAQDATHLGRMGRKAVQAEVIKDRATLGYTGLAVGSVARAEEILWILEVAKKEQGLPLVWATDNGSAYKDKRVEDFLRQEKVVHLLSRPRLPQDNAAAEKGIQELKVQAKLGKGTALASLQEAAQKLAFSQEILNSRRLRASKGYRTAEQLKESLPPWENKVSREVFYERACECREKAVEGGGTAREKRQAERQAVYQTLEKYQLVTRTRGGKHLVLATAEPEDIL